MDTTTESKRENQMRTIKFSAWVIAMSVVAGVCTYAVAHYFYCLLTVSIPTAWVVAEATVIGFCAALGAYRVAMWCSNKIDELSKK